MSFLSPTNSIKAVKAWILVLDVNQVDLVISASKLFLLLIIDVSCVLSCSAPVSLSSLSYADMWSSSEFDTAAVDVSSQVNSLILCCLDLSFLCHCHLCDHRDSFVPCLS